MAVSAVAAATIGSAVISSSAAKSAAKTQSNAANQAADAQLQATREQLAQQQAMYNQNVARMNPFVQAGQGALSQLAAGTKAGGQFVTPFSQTQFQADPSYQWRLQQGQKALQASAAAKGLLMSGQGAIDIANYGQNAASQEYQAAYNRYNDTQNQIFNRLTTLAGNSQNAAAGLGAQGTQVSSNMANTAMTGAQNASNYLTSGAAASAAGQVGAANAITGAIGSGLNTWTQLQYLNQMNPYAGSAAGAAGTVSGGSGLNTSGISLYTPQ